MKRILILPALALSLAACAPATTQAVTPPSVYVASQDAVFNTVLQVIATDPGVPNYKHAFNAFGENMERIPTGPWNIVSADKAGGFIRATAQSTLVTVIGSADSGQRENHFVSASITSSGPNTVVTVTPSERAVYLRDKIFAKLDATYPKAQ